MSSGDRSVVKTLAKGMEILDLVAASPGPISLSELGQQYDADQGTIHRFLNTLINAKYIGQDPETKRYYLSGKVLNLSRMFFAQHRIYDLARDAMLELSAISGETVQLSVISATAEAVLVDELSPAAVVTISSSIGIGLPMNCSAHGKILLSMQDPGVVERIMKRMTFDAGTAAAIRDAQAMKKEIGTIQKAGYSVENGEMVEGLVAVAAPIYNYTGHAVAALGIVGTCSSLAKERSRELSVDIVRLAEEISARAGYASGTDD